MPRSAVKDLSVVKITSCCGISDLGVSGPPRYTTLRERRKKVRNNVTRSGQVVDSGR